MFRFHSHREEIGWFNFDVELQRLEVYEADLLQRLETEDGREVVKIQEFLNRIAYETSRIKQLQLEYDNDV